MEANLLPSRWKEVAHSGLDPSGVFWFIHCSGGLGRCLHLSESCGSQSVCPVAIVVVQQGIRPVMCTHIMNPCVVRDTQDAQMTVAEVQVMDQPETRGLTSLFIIHCCSPGGNFGRSLRLLQVVSAVPRPIYMFQRNLYILKCWLMPRMENLHSLKSLFLPYLQNWSNYTKIKIYEKILLQIQ